MIFELEGTKHEKAVLVVLAYIIGITSGYIAFAVPGKLTQNALSDNTYFPPAEVMIDEEMGGDYEGYVLGEEAHSDDFAYYTNNRLFVQAQSGRMLLSVHANEFGDELGEEFANQGTHIAEPVFVTDEAEKNVFFCEFRDSISSCLAYVYNDDDTVIRPVVVDDAHLILTRDEASEATWDGGVLSVNGYNSDATQPWLLSSR
jgi:hypothetical protein